MKEYFDLSEYMVTAKPVNKNGHGDLDQNIHELMRSIAFLKTYEEQNSMMPTKPICISCPLCGNNEAYSDDFYPDSMYYYYDVHRFGWDMNPERISFCNKPNKLKILLRPSKTGRTNTVDNRDFLFQATVTNEDANKTSETKELIENSINSNEVKLNRNASVRESHEIKQSMEDLHYTSYDGSLTWRVDGFARKFAEAKRKKNSRVMSPKFYSSPTGYEMRCFLSLYGEGDAQGSHMSISIGILQGKHDTLLIWPFDIEIMFCLLDQSGQNHHIIDFFTPDPTSVCFKQPASEMNVPSGISRFCPLVTIKQEDNIYIRHNTMIIKVVLNFKKTPRDLFTYTLSVNPGLPQSIQDEISCEYIKEAKRIRQALNEQVIKNEQEIVQCALVPRDPPKIEQQGSYAITHDRGDTFYENFQNENSSL